MRVYRDRATGLECARELLKAAEQLKDYDKPASEFCKERVKKYLDES